MRRVLGAFALILAISAPAVGGGVAPAKEPEGPSATPPTPTPAPPARPPSATPAEPADQLSHKGMFEVSLRLALGFRAIVPYEKTDYCGATDSSTSTGNAPVCSTRAPFALDLELGYGVARKLDLFAEVRLGIESDFHPTSLTNEAGPRLVQLSPGARFFFSDAKSSKLFTTAQLVFDFSGYKDQAGESRGTDFGVRNLSGLWLDLEKAYGFYAYVGETATFARWLEVELEVGIGVQARYR